MSDGVWIKKVEVVIHECNPPKYFENGNPIGISSLWKCLACDWIYEYTRGRRPYWLAIMLDREDEPTQEI